MAEFPYARPGLTARPIRTRVKHHTYSSHRRRVLMGVNVRLQEKGKNGDSLNLPPFME